MPNDDESIRFGGFLLDASAVRLSHQGREIHLEPKVFRVLLHLTRNPRRLVSKEELLEEVWEGAFVTDNVLARAVAQLRHTLGDDPHDAKLIETVHGLGYRFVAELEGPETEEKAAGPTAESADTASREVKKRSSPPGRSSQVAAFTLVVIVAIAGYVGWRLHDRSTLPPTTSAFSKTSQVELPRIAILPFQNLGEPEVEFFTLGVTEEITTTLAMSSTLMVISRQSADRYAGSAKSAPEIGRELDVDYIMEGAVRWAQGDGEVARVRVTPQLIRVSDDAHIWAGLYEETVEDIFAVQGKIASAVLQQLGASLPEAALARTEIPPTANLEAYRVHLAGLSLLKAPTLDRQNLETARTLFARAVELDPDFARAHAFLSVANSLLYQTGLRTEATKMAALDSAERSLELDPGLPEGRIGLGLYHFYCRHDSERALAELGLAQKSLPNSSIAVAMAGLIHLQQGRFPAARRDLQRAFALDPLSDQLAIWQGSLNDIEGQYRQAARWYEEAISLAPSQPHGYFRLAQSLQLASGDLENARRALEAFPRRDLPAMVLPWFWQEFYERDFEACRRRLENWPAELIRSTTPAALLQGMVARATGEQETARQAFEEAREELQALGAGDSQNAIMRSRLALSLAGMGRKEEAVREAEAAIALLPTSKNARTGPRLIRDLAWVHVMNGNHAAALDRLEYLLSIPSGLNVSPALLRLDPRWDPLRDEPRFGTLVEQGTLP